ncbi:mechanosensitive ion channel domain-containing protein [Aquimonas voraii]|uniref:Potassium efflux system protein n=1 Tax=Aquimonas voraii TaxID=265719 RepID=A0A1G6ZJU2_9GAMM|nr:mechanosensitive ion channel domain-containing protein [Aquimonas voraii]SDE02810.1 potassium efflux system protein [Aquimonas voraii]
MTMRRVALSILLITGLASICSAALAGRTDTADADVMALDALRERISAAAGLADAQRTELLAQLDSAHGDRASAAQVLTDTVRIEAEAARAEAEARAIERELERSSTGVAEAERARIQTLETPEALEEELRALEARIEPLRREQQTLAASLDALDVGNGSSLARLRETIGTLEQRLAGAQGTDLESQATRTRQLAELELRRAELKRAEIDEGTAELRRRVLELKLRRLRQQLGEAEALASVVQARLGERSESELAELLRQLDSEANALAEAADPLRDAAATNLSLGREFSSANARLTAMRIDAARVQHERERIERALRDAASRLALGADTEAVGAVLLRERQRLPQPEGLQREVSSLREEAVQIRLRLFDLADAGSALEIQRNDLHRALEEADARDPAILARVDGLLQTRDELLRRLETSLRRLLERIEQAEVALDAQLAASLQLKALLDRQLFWIPSHRSVDFEWLRAQPAGWFDLLAPGRLVESSARAIDAVFARPWSVLAGGLLVVALFVLQQRARQVLPELARPTRTIREDSYRHTWQALGWTLLAALPWAALAWLCGRLLQHAGDPGRYTHSIGTALAALAGSIALFTFLRWLVIDNGLAHAHFRWTRARRDALARIVPQAALVLLPAQFLSTLALVRGQDLAIDTAGRSLLIVFAIACGLLFHWLLAPGRLWSPRGGVVEPVRLRQALRIGLPALLGLTVGLTLAGYVFTASVLVLCLWQTGGALLLVSLLHGLLGRWFLLGERRIALHRAEERRAAALAEGVSDGELPADIEADRLDIQSISAQTKRLLRALSATALVLLLFWVWADILPALQRLDEIALWSFSDKTADGSAIVGQVSLRAALLGAAVLMLTVIAARNLPGLLEIGLLTRVQIDAPTRYAITSVARYAIVILGVIIGLGFLGMRWSQLQWMAAALTVGLGFGLQEIFANFVSGLILLFERPFRVGDVITIGEFTGRVTRIRTRATTILDFDNREVVIPNKAFITDRLTNWTLTDSMTRVTIRVGVAYGSDVAQVHRLLLQAAAECPHIASEPSPRTWLLAFGPSSLDFELRVFVPAIDQRLLAQSDLHGRIATLLAEHGIEIAFPQMDLHVRDMPRAPAAEDEGEAARAR